MMRYWVIVLLLSHTSPGLAQPGPDSLSDKAGKIRYYFALQTASLIGCNDCGKGKEITFSGAIIQGVRYKSFRLGVGLGHDSYRNWNTAPVFLSAGWDIIRQKNALVMQVNYGTSLKTWRYYPYDFQEYGYKETSGGQTFNPALGYRVQSGKMNVTFGIGYKVQIISDRYEFPSWYWTGTQYVEGAPNRKTVKHELNRLVLSLAVGWN
ncbi:MAG: hypothetical protein KIT62_08905 [Cyclobacteriaceae bacterium]|nr:hypothetical protein [Cyclobacteriaceae bacterium]